MRIGTILRIGVVLFIGGGAMGVPIPSTSAQALCDCCALSATDRLCHDACEKAGALPDAKSGLCRPAIAPDAFVRRGRNNPLNGVDLKYLDLTGLTPLQLERVRRWAEGLRKAAERRFSRAKARAERGRIDEKAFAEAEARRDEALTNYHHIIRAYRDAMRAGR